MTIIRSILLAVLLAPSAVSQEFIAIDDRFDADAVSITGGAIDGVAIGGTTPAAGSFTSVSGLVSSGVIGSFQTTSTTAGILLDVVAAQSQTGTSTGLRASLNSSGVAKILLQNYGAGPTRYEALAISTGDAMATYTINGGQSWSFGADNSASGDPFKISASQSLGSSDVLTIDASGSFTFAGPLRRTVTAGITASTTQTQGQGALTAWLNEVSTVANANDTVTLPTAVAGMEVVVCNNGANTLQIFPASGDNLGAGVDTATTLAAGSNVTYVSFDATNWEVK